MSAKTSSYDHPRHMEPMMPEAKAERLAELTCTILSTAGRLRGQVHSPVVRQELSRLVREMNCYYSNLIEGHKTRPRDIERAMRQEFSADPSQRDNQELSLAHIATEEAMIERLKAEPGLDVYSPEFITGIHRDFYHRLPARLHKAKTISGKEYPVIPGQCRSYMVDVGRHTPPRHDCLDAFLNRFHSFYGESSIMETRRLTAIAAAHHRLGWIHPFGDGNGRVMRLHSHALLIKHGLDSGGLWTLSRGLARNRGRYYDALQRADLPRTGDLDGRGTLSDRGLADFCIFFLETIADQITFMSALLDLPALRTRVEHYFSLEMLHLKKDAAPLMRIVQVLIDKGEIQRSDVQTITGKGATVSARLIKLGLNEGLFTSPSAKGILQVHFGPALQDGLFPKLFLDLPAG